MADTKLTDQQVTDLPTVLRADTTLDSKVNYLTAIKSGIKQHNVPDHLVPQLFDGLRQASTSQHAQIVNAGFTALNHLLTRMSRQDPKLLAKEASRTLPVVIDKLGDQKDKFRALAGQSLTTLYAVVPQDVERSVRNSAMGGKNPRAKESALHWLLEMHREQGLQFRGYVPLLMDLLEDADGMVRDVAKSTVIELFRNAPNAAKSDLKRQLKNYKVRPAIEQAIVKELAPSSARPETPVEPAHVPVVSKTTVSKPASFAASVSSLSSERPVTPAVDARQENIEPQYVNTNRELDDIFKGMALFFEGRETEQNWLKREESIGTLRRLNAGNAPSDFHDLFVNGLRSMLDGILKAVNSLRTSLSKEGCGLVQDIALTLGPSIDPMVELLMQSLIKLSGGTKKIASQQANVTIDMIISRVTYNARLMQHLWNACQDKNVQPRTYAPDWLKTILKKESHHKSHLEHTGGVDVFEKCIKKGLADANPGVREKMRSTYWAFWAVWPARADAIMADLEPTAQKLLNKDPNNPNSPKKADPPRPGLGMSRSTMSSKPSLRETMLAQKRATLAAKHTLPARPGSAMAHISPVRTASNTSTTSASEKVPSKPAVRGRAEGTVSVNAGGMSVAPMRPVRRRPDMAARPATAGPYSVRDQGANIEAPSPETIKAKAPAPLVNKETTPRRVAPRTRPGHATHVSESSVVSPTAARTAAPKAVPSPRTSPIRLKQSQTAPPVSSPPRPLVFKEPEVPASPALDIASLKVSSPPQEALKPAQFEEQPEEEPAAHEPPSPSPQPQPSPQPSPQAPVPEINLVSEAEEGEKPAKPLEVYEDPFTEPQQSPPKPVAPPRVLEDKPVNEDAANLQKPTATTDGDVLHVSTVTPESPDKTRQNQRLLDSGIAKIKAKSLEVHGFRKLQSLLRDGRTTFADERFEALVLGLFQYLEDPLSETSPEKIQDVKAQILATIKLLLKTQRSNIQPYVSRGLESLLQTRAAYDSRAHIVSGIELLAEELVALGDGAEIAIVLASRLSGATDSTTEGRRSLGMGLRVLQELVDKRQEFVPSPTELSQLAELAGRCLDSTDSGVRMGAVQLCVALHSRAGEAVFWDSMKGVKDDPKSLITYYIVKRQREQGNARPSAV
ncbi:hypothetical protein NLU13_0755 [Sarocladium strictum]|uniref:TOG domain-containing protein n=1 Tax=Sarocladium strictum TaxID=5046 RepID=A0AA39GRK3_SARSR|nr:hypothetical protein NLU13_0755 [Sarocladium strictum]